MSALRLRVLNQLDLRPCDGCDECGIRCEAGVPMNRAEFEGVERFLASTRNRTEIAAVERQDKSHSLGDGVSVELCRFRDMERGRCMVYPARPLMCRLMGHVEWMPCPVARVERTAATASALDLMREYAADERRTYEEWVAGERLGLTVPNGPLANAG